MSFNPYRSLENCPICHGTDIRFFTYGLENPGLHKLLDTEVKASSWWRCLGCNHLFLNPRFSDALERRLYGAESLYRVYSIGGGSTDDYLYSIDNTIKHGGVHAGHLENIRDIVQRAELDLGKYVLDFGAGFGAASSSFEEARFEYLGYEFDDFCLEIARRNNRRVVKSIEPNEQFDLVYSAQVFEHIGTPRNAMEAITSFLRPSGYLYINVPTHQFQFYPPRNIGMGGINCLNWGHVHSYTKQSLATLIETEPTITVIDMWYRGFDLHCLARKLGTRRSYFYPGIHIPALEFARFRLAKHFFSPLHKGFVWLKSILKILIHRG